ncbi:hypothetical protein AGMMS49990_09270 [Endomicrobiia bacterium]|nr:hypothetical protein AGMMS49990_09270 [Endomicrobiia bacterium]
MSNKLKIGAKGTYTGAIVKPYLRVCFEQELDGKVKAAIQDGADKLSGMSSSSSKGSTAIAELGASAKVWKLDVDLSGQGYIGKRKGITGTLKIKYTF